MRATTRHAHNFPPLLRFFCQVQMQGMLDAQLPINSVNRTIISPNGLKFPAL
jgi:hypothetical protein